MRIQVVCAVVALGVCAAWASEVTDTFAYDRARRILPNIHWDEFHGDDALPQGFDNWRRVNPDGVAMFSLADSTEPGGRRFEAEGDHKGFVLAVQPLGSTFSNGTLTLDCDVKTPAKWVWKVARGASVGFGDADLPSAGHQSIGAHTLVTAGVPENAPGDRWYRLRLTVDLDARRYDVVVRAIGATSIPADASVDGPVVCERKGVALTSKVRAVSSFILRAYDCGARMPEGQADERICFDGIRVTHDGRVVYFNDGETRVRTGEEGAVKALAATAVPSKVARTATVNFSAPAGTVRAINGVNGGPSVKGRAAGGYAREFAQLNVASVRLHDIPLVNSGIKLVDVQDIFPVWNEKADVTDAANYFFAPTDDYLRTLQGCGVRQVIYRLGTSIEWSYPNKYFAKMPKDPARYAEICAAIVRHYAKGWANGPVGIVTHWEIWNEANIGNAMWDRSWTDYCRFYCIVAKRLKQEFPSERIGGPALCGSDLRLAKEFMDAAKASGAPIDFFSWHGYDNSPNGLVRGANALRAMLDEHGFAKAELHFNEWHYFPCTWQDVASPEGHRRWYEAPDGTSGVDAAAFTTLCLTVWQETPLTMSNFYMTTPMNGGAWALFDHNGFRRRTWHALEFFGRLAGQARVKAESAGSLGVLAAVAPDGRRRVLVSDFAPADEAGPLTLKLTGLSPRGTATAERIGDAQVAPQKVALEWKDGALTLPSVTGSSVWLIELTPGARHE